MAENTAEKLKTGPPPPKKKCPLRTELVAVNVKHLAKEDGNIIAIVN
jgi:hypothetical protein